MAIEFITPDMVSINGYFVEIRDSRTPDYFDRQSNEDNWQLQVQYPNPLQDVDVDLRGSWLTARNVPPEVVAYQQIPRLIDLAAQAAKEEAVSYRDFRVGAAAYAISTTQPVAAYLYGANFKPTPESDKYCAEFDIRNKARQRGLDTVLALAIYGPTEFGDVNTLQTPTLHPCEECRTIFDTDPLFASNPIVITSNDDGAIELMHAQDLIQLHAAE